MTGVGTLIGVSVRVGSAVQAARGMVALGSGNNDPPSRYLTELPARADVAVPVSPLAHLGELVLLDVGQVGSTGLGEVVVVDEPVQGSLLALE